MAGKGYASLIKKIVGCGLLIIMVLVTLHDRGSSTPLFSTPMLNLYVILFMLLALSAFTFGYYKHWRIENLFLLLFIPTGLLFLFIIPPGQVPDETSHFIRTYAMSGGGIYDTAAMLPEWLGRWGQPSGMYELLEASVQVLDETAAIPYSIGASIFYPPFSYLPQAAGVFIARLFTSNYFAVYYAGRFVSFAAITATLYFCIKKMPAGKNLLFAIALMPMFMQEAISLSADGLALAVIAADVAFFTFWQEKNTPLTTKARALLLLLCMLTLTVKPLYFPFAFLFAFLPQCCFSTKNGKSSAKLTTLLMVYGGALFTLLAWYIPIYLGGELFVHTAADAGIVDQAAATISNPLVFLSALANALMEESEFFFRSLTGYFLWFSVNLPFIFRAMQMVALAVCVTKDIGLRGPIRAKDRCAMWSFAIASVIVIFLCEYLQWSPVGENVIYGVQGRYFLPLLLPVFLAVTGKNSDECDGAKYPVFYGPPCVMLSILAISAVFILSGVTN